MPNRVAYPREKRISIGGDITALYADQKNRVFQDRRRRPELLQRQDKVDYQTPMYCDGVEA